MNFHGKPVTETDIEYAYKLLLGREPESKEAITNKPGLTFDRLRETFLNCNEFRDKLPLLLDLPTQSDNGENILTEVDYPAPHIDYVASESQMTKMLAHIEKVWSQYGNDDPYWSVLTAENYRKESITQERINEFYASGNDTLRQIEMSLRRCGQWGNLGEQCLEYGCGVGRVTVHLAKLFKSVTGVDISQGHLDIASNVSKQMGISNIEWNKVTTLNELKNLGTYDFIFTVIVLQHNPPPIMAHILKSLLNLLRDGGIAMFQLPTRMRNYRFDIEEYVKNLDYNSEMEGHVLPQNAVLDIIDQNSCRPLEIQCDNWVGSPHAISQTFIVKKEVPK